MHKTRLDHRSALLAILLCACSTPAEPPNRTDASTSDLVVPLCQAGCIETDPAPGSPGLFIGGVNSDVCFGTLQTDADQDRRSDYCEKNLAAQFAPELFYYAYDEMGGEPRWVAQPLDANEVQLAYLPAYYRDAGSLAYICTLPFAPSSCRGHNGDSEAISLVVYFDEDTRHWILRELILSQHGNMVSYSSGSQTPLTGITYPGAFGGYPRIWESQGKHANYPTQSICNLGGTLETDTCTQNDTGSRIYSPATANIGSYWHHTQQQDCTVSGNTQFQYYGSGRSECFWQYVDFRGWIPVSVGGEASTPYRVALEALGFGGQ